jgi:hypothetical protein
MLATTTTTEQAVTRPETFRLPKPGVSDPYFGFSRSFYYVLDKRLAERGEKLLIHIRDGGKARGVTLIPYEKVAAFVRAQMEAQDGGAK